MDLTPSERGSLLLSGGMLVAVIVGGLFFLRGKNLEAGRIADPNLATISVSGEGKVAGAPDVALLSLGVQTGRQSTSKAANDLLAKNMNAVLDAIKKAGVAEKDISTQYVSLDPVYNYTTGTQTITGYQAAQSLQVKVRDLDKASDVLSAATAAGANQAGGVQFVIDEPEELRAQARAEAIAQAKEKAQALADQLGMRLGKIRGFNEEGNGYYPPMPYGRGVGGAMAMDAAESSIPLPSGEQDVTVMVNITYELL